MVNALLKVGQFFRILDSDGLISLTNLAVYITLYKLATSSVTNNYTDIAALIAALSSYTAKKIINNG